VKILQKFDSMLVLPGHHQPKSRDEGKRRRTGIGYHLRVSEDARRFAAFVTEGTELGA
jgi:hypothetical protein